MAGEDFDGQDAGYVPEDPNFEQNHSDEHDAEVIDNSGFPQQESEEHDAGNVVEEYNPPENHFDELDAGDLPGNSDSPQKHLDEQHDIGDIPESFDSVQKQEHDIDSKGSEIKRWPGWPGENVFRMLVPVQKVGSIIGRKGEFIKKITEETKARIKILDGPPGTSERAVSLLLIFSFFSYSMRNKFGNIDVSLKLNVPILCSELLIPVVLGKSTVYFRVLLCLMLYFRCSYTFTAILMLFLVVHHINDIIGEIWLLLPIADFGILVLLCGAHNTHDKTQLSVLTTDRGSTCFTLIWKTST